MTEREAAAASARPELDLKAEGDFAHLAPASWDDDYRRMWLRWQAAEHNKMVYRRAMLAASAPQAVRRPLTEEQIDALYEANCEPRNPYAPSRKFFGRTVRAAEFAHGIVPLAPQDTGEK